MSLLNCQILQLHCKRELRTREAKKNIEQAVPPEGLLQLITPPLSIKLSAFHAFYYFASNIIGLHLYLIEVSSPYVFGIL